MYLFDTDTITNLVKKNPSKRLTDKISNLKKKEQFISTITIGEIFYGAFKSSNPKFHIEKLHKILLPLVNVLSFDSAAAFFYGKIRAELEKRGETITSLDLQVASIAIANELILITGNTKHFKRITQLHTENWIEDYKNSLT